MTTYFHDHSVTIAGFIALLWITHDIERRRKDDGRFDYTVSLHQTEFGERISIQLGQSHLSLQLEDAETVAACIHNTLQLLAKTTAEWPVPNFLANISTALTNAVAAHQAKKGELPQ